MQLVAQPQCQQAAAQRARKRGSRNDRQQHGRFNGLYYTHGFDAYHRRKIGGDVLKPETSTFVFKTADLRAALNAV
jgi:hypothetical protein